MQFYLASYRYEIFIEVDAWRQVYYPVIALIQAASVQTTKFDKRHKKCMNPSKAFAYLIFLMGALMIIDLYQSDPQNNLPDSMFYVLWLLVDWKKKWNGQCLNLSFIAQITRRDSFKWTNCTYNRGDYAQYEMD